MHYYDMPPISRLACFSILDTIEGESIWCGKHEGKSTCGVGGTCFAFQFVICALSLSIAAAKKQKS